MLRAYFDTNVYKHLEEHARGEDVLALRRALQDGRLLVRLSLVNILEVLAQAETDRAAMIEVLGRIRRLVGYHHGILREPAHLLPEVFAAYANGSPAPSVLLPEEDRRLIVVGLRDIVAGSRSHDSRLAALVATNKTDKTRWLEEMKRDQAAALAAIDASGLDDRRAPSFEAFLQMPHVDHLLGLFAERFGCEEGCRRRGLRGLLKERIVQIGIGVRLSQIYSELVRHSGNRRSPDRGDVHDALHATTAATTDLVLTFDDRLADHIERVPNVGGFAVIRSVPALLAAVDSTHFR